MAQGRGMFGFELLFVRMMTVASWSVDFGGPLRRDRNDSLQSLIALLASCAVLLLKC